MQWERSAAADLLLILKTSLADLFTAESNRDAVHSCMILSTNKTSRQAHRDKFCSFSPHISPLIERERRLSFTPRSSTPFGWGLQRVYHFPVTISFLSFTIEASFCQIEAPLAWRVIATDRVNKIFVLWSTSMRFDHFLDNASHLSSLSTLWKRSQASMKGLFACKESLKKGKKVMVNQGRVWK